MLPEATVLIPTFSHGPTLLHSVQSVLDQTVRDIEVFIVGDGIVDAGREIVTQFTAKDSRVRFFDNPKGPRHGEIYRHAALQEARGEIVCYLSDDDLYLPGHVAAQLQALENADFAHALPVFVRPDGSLGGNFVDISLPYYRDGVLAGMNRVPLSCFSHTLEYYRRLPQGWRTTPAGLGTDFYMYQQFLAQDDCRAVSPMLPTVLNFPSTLRKDFTEARRERELREWSEKIKDPGFAYALALEMLGEVSREAAAMEARLLPQVEAMVGQIHDIADTSTWKLRSRLKSVSWLDAAVSRLKNLSREG